MELIVSLYNFFVFVNKEDSVNIIIAVYIDNLLVCECFINQINNILKHLQSKFKITNLSEVANYLSIEINIEANFITVHQTAYIYNMLQYFKM